LLDFFFVAIAAPLRKLIDAGEQACPAKSRLHEAA
jgi:hypothetical protein